MNDIARYILERRFKAPPELVWEAWTNETYQARWFGPGVETVVHLNEPRTAGLWRVEMKGQGWSAFQSAEYVAFDPPGRLVFLQSMTDRDWNVIANPRMPDWPRVLRTDVTFTATGDGRTDMRLVWTPHEATTAEIACFADALEGLGRGWGMGMDILDEILAEMRA